jgi:RNA polymerase sigma-70 factor (ECF subfamily)
MNREKSITDLEHVKAFQDGDIKSFDVLVGRHQDRVFNICYRMLGNYEDAGDCAQDVFIRVYKSLGGFRHQSAFSTWLYRIAVNTCKNRLASAAFRRERSVLRINGARDGTGEEHVVEIGDRTHTPNGNFERRELEAVIQEAILSLPDKQRTLVVLRDVEGMTYDEIVKITGLNLGTVKSRIARARERLKHRLKGLV